MNLFASLAKVPILRHIRHSSPVAFDYVRYWEERYANGGTSGAGSYGVLAEYKSVFLNSFVAANRVETVLEFGCGDGHQLTLAKYPRYHGLDAARSSTDICEKLFAKDSTKSFSQYRPGNLIAGAVVPADLVICIDVLYHIIDESDFVGTLNDIFSASRRFVIFYTSLFDGEDKGMSHIRHRNVLRYLNRWNAFDVVAVHENPHADLTTAQFVACEKRPT